MAKASKAEQNGSANEHVPAIENVLESIVTTAPAEQPKRKEEKKEEIELRYGQCIIAPVGKEDEEILTTIDDWNSLYNAGDNKGRFVLKAEKKSS